MDSESYYVSNERILSIALAPLVAVLIVTVIVIIWIMLGFTRSHPDGNWDDMALFTPLILGVYTLPWSVPFFIWFFVRKNKTPKRKRTINNWKKVMKSSLKAALVIVFFASFKV